MKVHSLIRDQPWYRRQAFERGVQAAGHTLQRGYPMEFNEDTALLIWNRYAENHTLALKVEAAGGKVLVAENGYLGKGGTSPKFDVHPDGPRPDSYYALSPGYHNDDTRVAHVGGSERWEQLEVALKPYRLVGDYWLVAPNRSFGVAGRMQPAGWAIDVVDKLQRSVYSLAGSVRLRLHPGSTAPRHPLADDLSRAIGVVIWSSTVGVHALCEGIPLECCAPFWVCKSATAIEWTDVSEPSACAAQYEDARYKALVRMAWMQWTVNEIESGLPFTYLL
jgi:hypothetical protein